jgi:hypothetical protein
MKLNQIDRHFGHLCRVNHILSTKIQERGKRKRSMTVKKLRCLRFLLVTTFTTKSKCAHSHNYNNNNNNVSLCNLVRNEGNNQHNHHSQTLCPFVNVSKKSQRVNKTKRNKNKTKQSQLVTIGDFHSILMRMNRSYIKPWTCM